jgi:hypothetical protein
MGAKAQALASNCSQAHSMGAKAQALASNCSQAHSMAADPQPRPTPTSRIPSTACSSTERSSGDTARTVLLQVAPTGGGGCGSARSEGQWRCGPRRACSTGTAPSVMRRQQWQAWRRQRGLGVVYMCVCVCVCVCGWVCVCVCGWVGGCGGWVWGWGKGGQAGACPPQQPPHWLLAGQRRRGKQRDCAVYPSQGSGGGDEACTRACLSLWDSRGRPWQNQQAHMAPAATHDTRAPAPPHSSVPTRTRLHSIK